MPRWHAELASVGWPVAELAWAVDEARPGAAQAPPEQERQRLILEHGQLSLDDRSVVVLEWRR